MYTPVFFILAVCCFSVSFFIPLDEFFEYAKGVDDGGLQSSIVYESITYYGTSYVLLLVKINGNKVEIDPNGVLVFSSRRIASHPPVDYTFSSSNTQFPMIAPFSAEIPTSILPNDIASSARLVNETTGVEDYDYFKRILAGVKGFGEEYGDFNPSKMLIVTWRDVPYLGSTNNEKTNTFQCVIAFNATKTFVLFLYEDNGIQWTTGDNQGGTNGLGGSRPARIGFDAADGGNTYTSVLRSLNDTECILKIDDFSNIGIPGMFLYEVSNGVRSPVTECPLETSSSGCNYRIKKSVCAFATDNLNTFPESCRQYTCLAY